MVLDLFGRPMLLFRREGWCSGRSWGPWDDLERNKLSLFCERIELLRLTGSGTGWWLPSMTGKEAGSSVEEGTGEKG